jgi:hypothetical protein
MTYFVSCPLSRLRERARVRADGLCKGRALALAPLALTPTLSPQGEREQEKEPRQ